ncbi:hypothetical protein BDW42DRAFT_169694 [Aspergillus taichungensis]|uniref:Secreted protein n=1 Tax=Aspergillus taichungensis TaxID=482145 RepID=A0A2J5HUH3_9EURO|nr:hypothetical protein BDW42DRAFT_169694 [Aspergillus taichungensis]
MQLSSLSAGLLITFLIPKCAIINSTYCRFTNPMCEKELPPGYNIYHNTLRFVSNLISNATSLYLEHSCFFR